MSNCFFFFVQDIKDINAAHYQTDNWLKVKKSRELIRKNKLLGKATEFYSTWYLKCYSRDCICFGFAKLLKGSIFEGLLRSEVKLAADWLLFVFILLLKHSNQLESSISSDQTNPSKLEPFKSYNKTINVKLFP